MGEILGCAHAQRGILEREVHEKTSDGVGRAFDTVLGNAQLRGRILLMGRHICTTLEGKTRIQ